MPTKTQLGAETLQRDASALFSFVDSICQQCDQDIESPAYLKSSIDFLDMQQSNLSLLATAK
jgi:hypothetical protein